jgi:hypothetical protein
MRAHKNSKLTPMIKNAFVILFIVNLLNMFFILKGCCIRSGAGNGSLHGRTLPKIA